MHNAESNAIEQDTSDGHSSYDINQHTGADGRSSTLMIKLASVGYGTECVVYILT